MPITSWVNKVRIACAFSGALLLALSPNGLAGDLDWIAQRNGQVPLQVPGGGLHKLRLSENAEGIYYDGSLHPVLGRHFMPIFEVVPSTPDRSQSYCGAGQEVWLVVYEQSATVLRQQARELVSSCLHSISLASQNSGLASQDTDFSSVQWSGEGFSIEWFYKADEAGKRLASTEYLWHGHRFERRDLLPVGEQLPRQQ